MQFKLILAILVVVSTITMSSMGHELKLVTRSCGKKLDRNLCSECCRHWGYKTSVVEDYDPTIFGIHLFRKPKERCFCWSNYANLVSKVSATEAQMRHDMKKMKKGEQV